MSTQPFTVWGIAADALGHARWHTFEHNGTATYRSITASAQPAAAFLRTQPGTIGIDVDHSGRWIGETVYLERANGNLHVVGVVEGVELDEDGPFAWSASVVGKHHPGSLVDEQIRMDSIALTRSPAGIGCGTVTHLPGDIRRGAAHTWPLNIRRGLLQRAADYSTTHRRGDPHTIADVGDPLEVGDPLAITETYERDQRPPGPLRIAGARGTVLAVR